MIVLLLAAGVLAGAPDMAQPQPFAGPRLGFTADHVRLCPSNGRRQASWPQIYRPQDGGRAFRLIDLPPGHLCLVGGGGK